MVKILICDDEKDIVRALKIYLTAAGYETAEAYNGSEALKKAGELGNSLSLVLMDVMMPVMDGITAVTELRKTSNVPVIFLSAKGEDTDKILGLELGGDDYVTKPFNPVELLARVKSQLRRYTTLGSAVKDDILRSGTLEVDDSAKTVTRDGESVELTPTEYDILLLMMKNRGKVLSLKDIYTGVWGGSPFGAENTVPVHIRHLREKIEYDPANPVFIKVVWGKGYKLDSCPDKEAGL